MPEREKLTVIVPTYNEEQNIAACLETVKWAHEILVVDSFSRDRKRGIGRQGNVRFVQHEYVNSATQKNWAIPQATHPWVMIVDADERVTPELRDEVLQTLSANHAADGYRIGRINYFKDKKIRFSGWQNDSCLRLFKRDLGRYQDRQVHADVIVDGRVGRLKSSLIHRTFQSFDQDIREFERYTDWGAGDREGRSRRAPPRHRQTPEGEAALKADKVGAVFEIGQQVGELDRRAAIALARDEGIRACATRQRVGPGATA